MRGRFGLVGALIVGFTALGTAGLGVVALSQPADAATAAPLKLVPAPQTPVPVPTPAPAPQAPAPANALPPPKVINQKTYGDWVYSCLAFANGKTACSISQTLSDVKTKKPVFLWRIGQDGKGGLIGIWQSPTGVLVGRGIVLDAGTPKPIAIPFEFCGQGGCEATGNLAPDFLASLSNAQKASATIFQRDGKGVTFPLSVKGLADGLAALK
jgi:invasion protein IalB